MVKDEISAVISNPKLHMSNFKISLNAMKRFFILTINNKHTRNALILQSILRASISSIGVPSHFCC